MNNTDLFKNIWIYQKAGFENAYNSTVAIHNKTRDWIDETPLIPEQGKEFAKSWMNKITETRDEIKDYVTDQQKRFEALWTSPKDNG